MEGDNYFHTCSFKFSWVSSSRLKLLRGGRGDLIAWEGETIWYSGGSIAEFLNAYTLEWEFLRLKSYLIYLNLSVFISDMVMTMYIHYDIMYLPTGAWYMLAITLFWLLCNLSCITFALLWERWGGLQVGKRRGDYLYKSFTLWLDTD